MTRTVLVADVLDVDTALECGVELGVRRDDVFVDGVVATIDLNENGVDGVDCGGTCCCGCCCCCCCGCDVGVTVMGDRDGVGTEATT